MSLTSETHSEYERRGGRWALNRRARPPSERGTVEAIQCGLSQTRSAGWEGARRDRSQAVRRREPWPDAVL